MVLGSSCSSEDDNDSSDSFEASNKSDTGADAPQGEFVRHFLNTDNSIKHCKGF